MTTSTSSLAPIIATAMNNCDLVLTINFAVHLPEDCSLKV